MVQAMKGGKGSQPPGRRAVQPQPALSDKEKKDLEAIIKNGDATKMVEEAESLGKTLADAGLKTHQIRRFFGAVRLVKMSWKTETDARKAQRELLLLAPRLAYQRKRIPQISKLEEVLRHAVVQIEGNKELFDNFVDFFEAIVAYHKAYSED